MGNVFSFSLDPSCCLNCIIGEAKYVSELLNNLASLKTEQQNLVRLRDDVIVKINLAEQRRMKPTNHVQGWLQNVEKVVVEVDQLLTAESEETKKICLGGYCSKNCKSSYKYGKQVHKKLQRVDTLKKQSRDFGDNVAERVPEAPVRKLPIEPTILGQEYVFDEVWRYIREERVSIIGLFGTGGVGKTTLLTRINNKFCDQQQLHFDVVIWTVVSKELRLEKIQEDIGKRIGLWDEDEKWKQKNLHEKAQDILEVLSEKRFVLLLDDLWESVDLKEVGVPNADPNTSSKVIFTTRFEDVCGKMDARAFRVKCLGRDEAWELFRENLHGVMLDSRPDILGLAKQVSDECGGLPLVIKTIAVAMSCSTAPEDWRFAIQVLKRPAPDYAGVDKFSDMKKFFHRLKFSYDRLGENCKSCFKYCCLFPEDYPILKRELINCWIGEGFLKEFGGKVLIDEGYTIINTLLRACLLEEEESDCVKMHDVIRDMALWVSCEVEKENGNVFICAGAGLTKTVEASKWEGVTRMSLMDNRIRNLPDAPRCPSLITLFLNGNRIATIPHDFFQYMSSLRVLNLSDNYALEKLPSGISKLVLLEYLNLRRTYIEELPEELKALVNLRCLILDDTPMGMIPTKLVSSFSRLQVLILPPLDGPGVLYDEYGELLVNELVSLEHLSVLNVTIRSLNSLQEIISAASHKLQRFTLNLVNFERAKSFDILSLADVECLDELHLSFLGLEELKINCAWKTVEKMHEFQGFKNLQRVTIGYCFRLREATWLIFARNIRALMIEGCHELEEVISYEKLGEASEITEDLYPFSKLEFLSLRRVRILKSIYWKALPFPQLKEITVTWCPNLKKLPLASNSTREHKVVIRGGRRWWKELEWEDQPDRIAFLPYGG